MANAKCIHGGAQFNVRVGTRVAAILRPGKKYGTGPVPSDSYDTISVTRARGDYSLDADDLEPGTIVWVIDPDSRGNDAENPDAMTAWPSKILSREEWARECKFSWIVNGNIKALIRHGLYKSLTPAELVSLDQHLESAEVAQ